MLQDEPSITFRPLAMQDLPLMHRWLGAGAAREWYARRDMTFEQVKSHYLTVIQGLRPTYGYIVMVGQAPVGYVQTYRIRDYPAYARSTQVEPNAAGVDIFIGDAAHLHRGVGARALSGFLQEVTFADAETCCCYVGPDPANTAAIRCYEKVGFRYVKTIQVPEEDAPEYLMRVGREQWVVDSG